MNRALNVHATGRGRGGRAWHRALNRALNCARNVLPSPAARAFDRAVNAYRALQRERGVPREFGARAAFCIRGWACIPVRVERRTEQPRDALPLGLGVPQAAH